MRKLILVRGPQGSGKSTLIEQTGLASYALSLDTIRQVVSGPTMTADGRLVVAGEFNDQVCRMHRDLVAARMERGEFLVIEQALMFQDDVNRWRDLAARHRYEVLLVDLTNIPLDIMLERNAARPEHTRVPEKAVRATFERMIRTPKVDIPTLEWSEDIIARVNAWATCPIRDLSAYKNIVHIGDLQGCFSVLAGPQGPLRDGLDPETYYIFVGDLLDRGLENGEVMRWMMDHVVGKNNAAILYGNHEYHLDLWSYGDKAVSHEFQHYTLPQLKRAGLTCEDARRLVDFTRDVLLYTYGEHKVMVTHAGLPTVPARPELISAQQYYKGTGHWGDPVDIEFHQRAPEGWVQVHGHRNQGPLPIQASERSFNLEDSVEYGGSLRTATLTADGWSTHAYPNTVFAPMRERRRAFGSSQAPAWMDQPDATKLPDEVLKEMRDHPGVQEKTSASHPHIASLNFTRTVFREQSWDEVVTKARGLFFNKNTGEIVARAYDKFFNIGERPETQMDHILEHAAFPIRAFRKENGYLGLIGYDRTTDSLFFTSKSTPDSPFTTWLKEIYLASTTTEQQEHLRRYLRDMDSCIAVEAIDPARDPHMIAYPKASLVLLDVFHRSVQLERLPFEQLEAFGRRIGLDSKVCSLFLKGPDQLRGWYRRVKNDLTHQVNNQHIEGFVLEDARGTMSKIKLPYYDFWKAMRSAKDRMARLRRSADEQAAKGRLGINAQALESLIARYEHPLAADFLRWALNQPTAALGQDIITLRTAFEDGPTYRPETRAVPWIPLYQREEEPDPNGVGSANKKGGGACRDGGMEQETDEAGETLGSEAERAIAPNHQGSMEPRRVRPG
jgi:predicted kinase